METALQVVGLQELESRIEKGLQTFIDVGNCLLEIRDRRLYREQGYSRFEDYCQERWGWTKTHVNRQIEAAKTIEILTPVGVIPASERQARELTPLVKADEQEAVETWRQLREEYGDKITAEIVRNTVREKLKPEESAEQQPSAKVEAEETETPGNTIYYPEQAEFLPDKRPHVSFNSGENEWYTPIEYIQAAREVMGKIDLDPASSDAANNTVRADIYYTKQDDGLAKEWTGRVWMNPPYSSDMIGRFCDKIVCHFNAGQVTEAIVLVNNATETNWFNTLVECASAVVFPKGRVRYTTPGGETGAPLQGQAVVYMGLSPDRFMEVFSVFGWCARL